MNYPAKGYWIPSTPTGAKLLHLAFLTEKETWSALSLEVDCERRPEKEDLLKLGFKVNFVENWEP